MSGASGPARRDNSSPRLRLAWITPSYQLDADDAWSPGLTALAHRLAERHDLVVYSLHSRGARERFRVGQVEVFAFAAGPPASVPVVRRVVPFARAIATLLRRSRHQRPDIVHALWATEPALAGAIAAPLLGRPLLVSAMGGEPASLPAIGFGGARTVDGRFFLAAGARAAHTMTAGSRWHAEMLRTRVGRATPIAVMPLGIDIERFRASGARPPPAPGTAPLILAVGSLLPVKGHRALIEAFALLLARLPRELRGIRLRIVGEGPERVPLEKLIARLDLRPRIDLIGQIPYGATPSAYADADAFVLSSHYESQCLALVEALASGLPTVSTPVGLAPDLLGDGRAGELATRADPLALAEALERLLLRRNRWPELRRAASECAAPFAFERTTDRWIELYRQIACRWNAKHRWP